MEDLQFSITAEQQRLLRELAGGGALREAPAGRKPHSGEEKAEQLNELYLQQLQQQGDQQTVDKILGEH